MTSIELPYSVRIATWQHDINALKSVRITVFMEEQEVPEELEWDEFDEPSWHVLAEDKGGSAIGTGRLQRDGKITRIAVLPDWRRQGVADAMLTELLNIARQNQLAQLYMHAQTSALPLYRRHGFETDGEEFDEAGIPHITMLITMRITM